MSAYNLGYDNRPQTLALALFIALSLIQIGGLWISLTRLPYGPAVLDFFRREGWVGLWIPSSYVFSSALGTTVILAKLSEVFLEKRT